MKPRVKLKYCYACGEKSIACKTYIRQTDGVKFYFERCINPNPLCRYKFSRKLDAPINEAAKTSV